MQSYLTEGYDSCKKEDCCLLHYGYNAAFAVETLRVYTEHDAYIRKGGVADRQEAGMPWPHKSDTKVISIILVHKDDGYLS
jgi:hypothetical protein